MLEKFKFGFFALLILIWGSAQWAKADDELSCATDDECQRQKVEAGYQEFLKNERKAVKHKKPAKQKEPKPCALDYDCQQSNLDALDRDQGKHIQEN